MPCIHRTYNVQPGRACGSLSQHDSVARTRRCRTDIARTHAAATDAATTDVAAQLGITAEDVGTAVTPEEYAQWNSMWRSCPIERSYVVPEESITGEVPSDLSGTLLRNGPGNFDVAPGQRIQHPFDGDGVVTSYSFNGGGEVVMRRKFVRTAAQREEMTAGKLIYKGAFTKGDPSGEWSLPFPLKMRKSANVHVLWWAGKALALYDRDLPHVMDATLATEGVSTLGVWDKEDVMAGHHRIVTEADGAQRLVTFSSGEAGMDLTTKILELDEDGNKVHETEAQIKDAAFGFVHDFLVTENYYVIVENPTRMDFWKLLTKYTIGQACIAECLYHDKERPMKVHAIPRPGKNGTPRPAYEVQSKFAFHHTNAWDTDNGTTLVVDTLATNETKIGGPPGAGDEMEKFTDPDSFTTMRRFVCRGDDVKAVEHDFREVPGLEGKLCELPSPLPAWNCGRPHATVFALSSRDVPAGHTGLGQTVMKVSFPPGLGVSEPFDTSKVTVSQYYAGDDRYTQEPIFVPKPGASRDSSKPFDGNEGYLMVQVNDMQDPGNPKTSLEILDAENLEGGPLAVIEGEEMLPSGFHGSWTDTCMPVQPGEALPYENDIRVNL